MYIYAHTNIMHACTIHNIIYTHVHVPHTHTCTHTHLNPAVIEEPVGETHNSGVTPVVDEQLRLVGCCTRQLAVQVMEAH